MSDLLNETELRRLAERRVDAKAGLWLHAAIFVVVNAGMVFATPVSPWFPWSVGCWGLALIAQGVVVYVPVRDFRRRAIDAELTRLRTEARR